MKILFAGSLLPHRIGAARCCSELLVGLARRGHDVRAIAPWLEGASDGSLEHARSFDRERHPGVALARFPVAVLDNVLDPPTREQREAQKATLRTELLEAIAEQTPDLVLVGKESFTPGLPEITKRAGIPCVVAAHGAILAEKPDGYPLDWFREMIDALGDADRIVTCAHHVAAKFAQFGLPHVHPIPNGIDTRRFAPRARPATFARSLAIREDQPVVLHVSSLAAVKRAHDIVESAVRVSSEIPEAVFVVVGDGPEGEAVRAACDARGVAEHFRFTGWARYDDVASYFDLADVVVVPSQSEGLCRVVLEAQSSAKTVIASDIPANREAVEPGVSGILFPTGDVKTLAERIVTTLQDPAARVRMGREARRSVEERFTQERWIADHESAFESLLVRA